MDTAAQNTEAHGRCVGRQEDTGAEVVDTAAGAHSTGARSPPEVASSSSNSIDARCAFRNSAAQLSRPQRAAIHPYGGLSIVERRWKSPSFGSPLCCYTFIAASRSFFAWANMAFASSSAVLAANTVTSSVSDLSLPAVPSTAGAWHTSSVCFTAHDYDQPAPNPFPSHTDSPSSHRRIMDTEFQ